MRVVITPTSSTGVISPGLMGLKVKRIELCRKKDSNDYYIVLTLKDEPYNLFFDVPDYNEGERIVLYLTNTGFMNLKDYHVKTLRQFFDD